VSDATPMPQNTAQARALRREVVKKAARRRLSR